MTIRFSGVFRTTVRVVQHLVDPSSYSSNYLMMTVTKEEYVDEEKRRTMRMMVMIMNSGLRVVSIFSPQEKMTRPF